MTLVGKFLKRYVKDKERMDKYLRVYIHHRNLYTKGEGEFSTLRGIFNPSTIMICYLFFSKLMPDTSFWIIISFLSLYFIGKICLHWVLGWWWDKERIFQKEHDWQNKRDPVSAQINQQLLGDRGIEG